jgi:hypothetical protein
MSSCAVFDTAAVRFFCSMPQYARGSRRFQAGASPSNFKLIHTGLELPTTCESAYNLDPG